LHRQQQEALAKQQATEQQRVAQARAAAQAAQQRSAEAAAQRAQAEAQQRQAQLQQQQAQLQQQQAEQRAAQARQAAQQAELQRQQAEQQRQMAEQRRQQAEQQSAQLRSQLQQQLNQVLQTRNTARGLIVNMSDVLFDFNKYTLKPDAQLKLAKVAGILLAHPDLKVKVEGYTDNIGTPEYNLKLSSQRADTVRSFLVQQGVPSENVTAQGFGMANPVAPNSTPAGRQQNRRVDMVVSGASIGTPASTTPGGNPTPEQTPAPATP
jgi:outer membrane protein OmpA-like peptidoglycan-associated protein